MEPFRLPESQNEKTWEACHGGEEETNTSSALGELGSELKGLHILYFAREIKIWRQLSPQTVLRIIKIDEWGASLEVGYIYCTN